jgi:2-haloalkanoic acid dehalogenase type II
MNQPKAILFDCWNTLFTSNIGTDLRAIAGRFVHRPMNYGFVKAFEEAYMLEPHSDLEPPTRRLLAGYGLPAPGAVVRKVEGIVRDTMERQQPYPETFAVLEELRSQGYRLGMVTNSWQLAFERLQQEQPIDRCFDALITSYEAGCLKPDPKIFAVACERLGVTAADTVMVGDSVRDDFEAAKACGMRAVLIDRSGAHPDCSPRITSLHELPELLAQL